MHACDLRQIGAPAYLESCAGGSNLLSGPTEEHDAEPTTTENTETGSGRAGFALMYLDPEHAYTLLPRVDPGRERSGRAVGLRDGAVLALIAAGLTGVEIAALRASAITSTGRHVVVAVQRHRATWTVTLPTDLGARLIAWLTEARLWGEPEPVFRGCRGPLTATGIRKVLESYRNPQGRRRRFPVPGKRPSAVVPKGT